MDEDDEAKRLREHAASLQAEVERLKDAMTKAAGEFNGMSLKLTLERDALATRVERLQEALATFEPYSATAKEALAADTAAAKEAK